MPANPNSLQATLNLKPREVLRFAGLTAERIAEDFDTLTPKEIQDTLRMVARHCEIVCTDARF